MDSIVSVSYTHLLNQNGSGNLDFQAIAEEMDSQSVEEAVSYTHLEDLPQPHRQMIIRIKMLLFFIALNSFLRKYGFYG